MTELPAPAPPESPGAKKASRESCATPISPDSDNSSEKVDARTPGSPAESEARPNRGSQKTSPKALGPAAEEAGAALYACRHPRPLDADETRASKILRPIRYG